MEKTFLLVIFSLILVTLNLPKTEGYCSKVSSDWYRCSNIQDAEKIESTIQYFLESDSQIRKLSIEDCNMSSISTTLFAHDYFWQITDLNITNSLVEFIELGSFDQLKRLANLNITGNSITEFNGKIFEKLTYLKRLYLKNNQFHIIRNMCSARNLEEIFIEDFEFLSTTINKNTFINCDYVRRLFIINAGIDSLQTNISLHLSRLLYLNLSGNNFVDLESFDVNATLPIRLLDISNNKIKILDAEIFRKTFKNVDEIYLNNNLINYLTFSGQEPFENRELTSIFLNSNKLQIINNVFFKYFSYLWQLDIGNNPLQNIASLSFNNLNRLMILEIKNSLKSVNKLNVGIFDGLSSLEELDLSSASISSIENYVFKDLTKLTKLNLENNQFTELWNGTFAGLTNLRELNLSNNSISSIEAGTFFGLENIVKLVPKSFFSQITGLKTRQFEGLSYNYLSELDLSYLGIKTLEVQTFKGLIGLRDLHLQGNMIEELIDGVFEEIYYLDNLNISFGQLSNIHKGAFTGLSFLKTIDLSNNKLVQLHPDTFKGLNTLKMIDLSNNQLKRAEPWLFRQLHSLQTLYLHDNIITNLEAHAFTGLNSIKNLTISSKYLRVESIEAGAFIGLHSIASNLEDFFSRLTVLRTDMFDGISNLRNINFSKYRIEVIEPFAFRGINYIDLLDLEQNMISVLHENAFSSPVTIELLNLKMNRLNEISSKPFINSNITNLILDENNISTLDFGVISQIPYLQILNINNASITRLIRSRENVTYLKELYLRDNLIDYLNTSMFNGMNNLLMLDLSGNPITKIEFTAFEQLHNLQNLFLSNLKIDEISLATLSGLKSLKYLSILNSSMKYIRDYSFVNTDLRELVLANTFVDSFSPNAFTGLKNLTSLTISHSNLTMIETLFNHEDLVTLKKLNLNSNRLQSVGCHQLNLLKQLEILNLDNNEIGSVEVCAFNNLTNLKTLNLSSNKLKIFPTGTFSNLGNLRTLNVSYNNVMINNYDLYPLRKIEKLDFSYNSLDNVRLQAFVSLNPDSRAQVGLGGNNFACDQLFKTLQYFKNKSIGLLDYSLYFYDTNIDGIICYN